MKWSLSRASSASDDSANTASFAVERLYLLAITSLFALLKEALRALRGDSARQEQSEQIINDLSGQFDPQQLGDGKQLGRLEKRLRKDCGQLSAQISSQREAALQRESELSNVVNLLSRSVAEATRSNAGFYQDIRAEGQRIAQAAHLDDLFKLKSALKIAADKLDTLVSKKESHEQSRIDSLSNQVKVLKDELAQARATAQTDPLTGVLNRRSFDATIDNMVQACRGSRRSFALIMFDIDDFKRINDRYGHPVGDRMIIAFTRRCESLLRPEDCLARYGGEEFVVLLDSVSLRNALKRAKGICEAVAGARYAIEKHDGAPQIGVTVSAGVAAFRRDETAAELLDRADKALYLAKERGKNRALSEKDLPA